MILTKKVNTRNEATSMWLHKHLFHAIPDKSACGEFNHGNINVPNKLKLKDPEQNNWPKLFKYQVVKNKEEIFQIKAD